MSLVPSIVPNHLKIIKAILQKYLPKTCKVIVYGSRAKNIKVKTFSDLDLAIQEAYLEIEILFKLREEFKNSDLPYTVEISNFQDLPSFIQEEIIQNGVPLDFVS